MSHTSESNHSNNPLSQPLRVETEDSNVHHHSNIINNSNYYDEKDSFNHANESHDENDSLGPLPPKWEKAFTESGEVYFIDHSTGTSHWLDPRLSKFQKKTLEDCLDDELPYGWEKISDPHYGTYFIDHVNRRTQYENPVIQAKRAASTQAPPPPPPQPQPQPPPPPPPAPVAPLSTSSSSSMMAVRAATNRTYFTKDPSALCGERIRTSLVKSSRGLGFTIVGGDDGVDEFLQIKSVVPKGPAWSDGQLQTGDVIVFVNETCVLGYTHNQIVRLFQSISVGSTVETEVCRGYPLPFDPNDPNTEVVTTIAVDAHLNALSNENKRLLIDSNYNFLEGGTDDDLISSVSRTYESIDDDDDDGSPSVATANDIDELMKKMNTMTMGKVEVRVRIVKGNMGFGFTIADSACGQRVKKILDRQRCKNLLEGDILLEINEISLENKSHDDVVQVLKMCPNNSEATICVQRGCSTTSKSSTIRNKIRKFDTTTKFQSTPTATIANNKDSSSVNVNVSYRSKTPTAEIYSTQTKEILPTRPKTPLVDTRNLNKTSSATDVNSMNGNNNNNNHRDYQNDLYSTDINCLSSTNEISSSIIENNHHHHHHHHHHNHHHHQLQEEDDLDELDSEISENKQPSYEYPPQPVLDTKFNMFMSAPHRYDCICAFCSAPRPVNLVETNNHFIDNNTKKFNNHWSSSWCHQQQQQQNYRSDYVTMHIVLNRLENGFGFRIVGGIEDKSQVAVGQIVPGGAADLDGRMQTSDEIVSVEGFSVLKAEHRQVVQLINAASARGQVSLILRRRICSNTMQQQQQQQQLHHPSIPLSQSSSVNYQSINWSCDNNSSAVGAPLIITGGGNALPPTGSTYDVTVQRTENEGFGFVIISSINKVGSTIGRLIEDSPAERCGQLQVGDYIIAVNNINIMNLNHGNIVNLIKESGLSVTLTIASNSDL